MVKVWFPSFYMRLVTLNATKTPPQATLRVPPKMTKTEIKEYLLKIYDVTVTKISTTLFLGKWKRFYGKRRIIAYKRRNEKKAVIEYINSADQLKLQ